MPKSGVIIVKVDEQTGAFGLLHTSHSETRSIFWAFVRHSQNYSLASSQVYLGFIIVVFFNNNKRGQRPD